MSTKPDQPITITVELHPAVAYQLAQFCKRSTFDQFYDRTEAHFAHEDRNAAAYQMITGIEIIASALAKAGISPR